MHPCNHFLGCIADRDGENLEGNEMKNFLRKMKDESGQALVIVAASVIVLMGVTAFSVDMGMAYNAKAELQAAADAAALAGAQDLPDAAKAEASAINYAGFNDVGVDDVVVETPYNLNPKQIEVTCTKTFEYMFAKVLGFDSKVIVARAVATREADWAGDALPFMNLDDHYVAGQPIVLWEKTTAAGDDEKLWPRDSDIDAEYKITNTGGVYSSILLDPFTEHGWNGFALKSGIDNNDLKEIKPLVEQLVLNKSYVYVLSMVDSKIDASAKVNYGNKQIIPIGDIVLLKCQVIRADFGANDGTHGIYLTYTGTSYPFSFVAGGGEVPNLSGTGEPIIKLIE